MKKIILHIPHSPVVIPNKEGYVVDNDFLEKEILKLTDWYTDDLFNSDNEISIFQIFQDYFAI